MSAELSIGKKKLSKTFVLFISLGNVDILTLLLGNCSNMVAAKILVGNGTKSEVLTLFTLNEFSEI